MYIYSAATVSFFFLVICVLQNVIVLEMAHKGDLKKHLKGIKQATT